ncbi:MAG: YtxH domain-containing protein [Sphingomonadaceae bacterium]
MRSEESGSGGFVSGFLLGGLVGAAVALLLTPQRGEETRDTLMDKGIELKVKAEEVAARAREEADELITLGKSVIEGQKARILEAVEEGKEAAAEKKAELLSKYRVAKETGEVPEEGPALYEELPPRVHEHEEGREGTGEA